jgi:hypothetical protein
LSVVVKCAHQTLARAAIEDEYARKLLQLSRKPFGSQEAGTLRASLDVLRGEVEGMGKAHQTIAAQMKTELEEPLAAFAGAMKERRKIVQGGIEKLLKVKVQQTQTVNKVYYSRILLLTLANTDRLVTSMSKSALKSRVTLHKVIW